MPRTGQAPFGPADQNSKEQEGQHVANDFAHNHATLPHTLPCRLSALCFQGCKCMQNQAARQLCSRNALQWGCCRCDLQGWQAWTSVNDTLLYALLDTMPFTSLH